MPTEFQDPLNFNDKYKLIGIIRFIGNLEKIKEIGHYTTICYRQKQWFDYNDLTDKVAGILPAIAIIRCN